MIIRPHHASLQSGWQTINRANGRAGRVSAPRAVVAWVAGRARRVRQAHGGIFAAAKTGMPMTGAPIRLGHCRDWPCGHLPGHHLPTLNKGAWLIPKSKQGALRPVFGRSHYYTVALRLHAYRHLGLGHLSLPV